MQNRQLKMNAVFALQLHSRTIIGFRNLRVRFFELCLGLRGSDCRWETGFNYVYSVIQIEILTDFRTERILHKEYICLQKSALIQPRNLASIW